MPNEPIIPSASENRLEDRLPELSELVPGDLPSIERALDWLEGMNRGVKNLAGSVRPALHADALGPHARAVIFNRAEQVALDTACRISERSYEGVVAPHIQEMIDPLIDEAFWACIRLADGARQGALPAEEMARRLSCIGSAPRYELKKLLQLLVVAQITRQGPSHKANEQRPARMRCSTSGGDARIKIIAALTKHHQFESGGSGNPSCGNLMPIGVRELGRNYEVGRDAVSQFFKTECGSHEEYQATCLRAPASIACWLKLLRHEYSPHPLFSRTPPGEGRDPDE
jgi:hypothetical protein